MTIYFGPTTGTGADKMKISTWVFHRAETNEATVEYRAIQSKSIEWKCRAIQSKSIEWKCRAIQSKSIEWKCRAIQSKSIE